VRPLAIFDIDSTLADVQHRVHWLEGAWRDYGSFFSDAVDDTVLEQGAALVHEAARECEVAYVTGRPEWCRADTLWWLREHGLPLGPLMMRHNGDHRPARIAKVELLAQLAEGRVIAVVVDDDDQVVKAYQQQGWPVLHATWAQESAALARAQEDEGRT
jgi:hypothetical protein